MATTFLIDPRDCDHPQHMRESHVYHGPRDFGIERPWYVILCLNCGTHQAREVLYP